MAIAHVQSANAGSATGGTSQAVTVTAIGSGNLVAGFVFWGSGTTTDLTSVTDNQGNTYTIADRLSAVAATTRTRCFASFYLPNITNAPTTITANFGSSIGKLAILVDEYSGVATAAPLDGHNINVQVGVTTSTDAVTSGNITTSINGDLIYAAAVDLVGNSAVNAGTGFTQRLSSVVPNGEDFFSTEDQITQVSAGTIAATFTRANSGGDTMCGIMAFSPPGGGGFTPKFRRTLSQVGTRIGSRQAMAA